MYANFSENSVPRTEDVYRAVKERAQNNFPVLHPGFVRSLITKA